MRKRRIIIATVVLALLVGVVVVVWEVADWPPPRLILKYGFPPTGGPTGRTRVIAGIEFVEVGHGYCRIPDPFPLPGKPLPFIDWTVWEDEPEWVVFAEPFWITRAPVFLEEIRLGEGPDARKLFEPLDDFFTWDAWQAENLPDDLRAELRLPTVDEWNFALHGGALDGPQPTVDFTYVLEGDSGWIDWKCEVTDRGTRSDPTFYVRGYNFGESVIRGLRLVWIPPEDE